MLCQQCFHQLDTILEKEHRLCNGCWPENKHNFVVKEIIDTRNKNGFYYVGFTKNGSDTAHNVAMEFNIPLTDFLTILKNNNATINYDLSDIRECFYSFDDVKNAIYELRSYVQKKVLH